MSARETAITALLANLRATAAARPSPRPQVYRNETYPQKLPSGGLVVLRDGETAVAEAIMSPLRFHIEHESQVEIIVGGESADARSQALDALLVAFAAGIASARTLGGAVEYAEIGPADLEDIEYEGAAPLRAARFTVTLQFSAADTPLS